MPSGAATQGHPGSARKCVGLGSCCCCCCCCHSVFPPRCPTGGLLIVVLGHCRGAQTARGFPVDAPRPVPGQRLEAILDEAPAPGQPQKPVRCKHGPVRKTGSSFLFGKHPNPAGTQQWAVGLVGTYRFKRVRGAKNHDRKTKSGETGARQNSGTDASPQPWRDDQARDHNAITRCHEAQHTGNSETAHCTATHWCL